MNFLNKTLVGLIFNGGIGKQEYKDISPIIDEHNKAVWKHITAIVCAVFSILWFVSIFVPKIYKYNSLYLGIALYSLITMAIFFLEKDSKTKGITFFTIYSYCFATYTFCLILAFLSDKTELTVAFMVLLIAMPLVVIDKPYRLIIMNFLFSVLYIVAVIFVKDESIRLVEILNCIIYTGTSFFCATYVNKTRLTGLLTEYRINQKVFIDALTGMGNELAYLNKMAELDKNIEDGTQNPFAIVMMDVNNVKTINDMYGHVFGCSLIVEGGHYIRSLFENSKTFHIGGDEYIAVLEGKDYDNREKLIEEFDNKMKDYYYTRENVDLRLVIARGIAVYEPETDKSYKTVFQRSDSAMYENKKYVKKLYNLPQR